MLLTDPIPHSSITLVIPPQNGSTPRTGKSTDPFAISINCLGIELHRSVGNGYDEESSRHLGFVFYALALSHVSIQAVNMAKSLLKNQNFSCDDLTDDTNQDCVMEGMLRSIVADQNFQIQAMLGVLTRAGYPLTDKCTVEIESSSIS